MSEEETQLKRKQKKKEKPEKPTETTKKIEENIKIKSIDDKINEQHRIISQLEKRKEDEQSKTSSILKEITEKTGKTNEKIEEFHEINMKFQKEIRKSKEILEEYHRKEIESKENHAKERNSNENPLKVVVKVKEKEVNNAVRRLELLKKENNQLREEINSRKDYDLIRSLDDKINNELRKIGTNQKDFIFSKKFLLKEEEEKLVSKNKTEIEIKKSLSEKEDLKNEEIGLKRTLFLLKKEMKEVLNEKKEVLKEILSYEDRNKILERFYSNDENKNEGKEKKEIHMKVNEINSEGNNIKPYQSKTKKEYSLFSEEEKLILNNKIQSSQFQLSLIEMRYNSLYKSIDSMNQYHSYKLKALTKKIDEVNKKIEVDTGNKLQIESKSRLFSSQIKDLNEEGLILKAKMKKLKEDFFQIEKSFVDKSKMKIEVEKMVKDLKEKIENKKNDY